ncbi:cysteine desulfurase [Methylobacterium sp. Leaf108]|uniref:cysteine desulfurase n=1 Tax=Methylobacterium sp. Leaf108 TaxID=1736256 RepID=UPI0006F47885|nr:cysteine desulfurase [Methylobacterium sp. Leaf108]KQP60620.1 cysteine desulfurase [Methylobacterium sp. Leaf108]
MTTPETGFLHAAPGFSGQTSHADLVARLANEIYGRGHGPSAPFTPAQAPGVSREAGVGSRSFGTPPVGVPGITHTPPPDTATIPSVHPLAEPQALRPLPEFFVPSLSEAAAGLPGGPDLHRRIAGDHPRATAFADALAGAFALPSVHPQGAGPATEPARHDGGRPSSRHVRTVEYPGDYYFLTSETSRTAPRPAASHQIDEPLLDEHRGSRAGGTPTHVHAPASAPPAAAFDVETVRKDFPALHQTINGHPLVWLDNAATTHKPRSVIDATSEFYGRHNSNIHRAAHTLAARSTDLFEGARETVRRFLNAPSKDDIVFLRGTTEAINLVANSYGRANIGPGDEIIVSQIEHHANIVPWQLLTQATGATLRVIPVNDRGEIVFERFAALLSGRTRIVSVTHVANALGTINPVAEIIALSHAYGVPVLVDAAQSSPHIPLDVQALDADFLVFSGHKVFGPTGIGALYGKTHLLAAMPPWQGGGHMIEDVTFAKTVYKGAPEKFEAGTPDIAGAVGLGAALDYLEGVGLPGIAAYEHDLLEYAQAGLAEVRGVRLIGTARRKASVMSFTVAGHDNEAVAKHLDARGIAVRSGHHCALPALRRFGVDQSVRASLAFYNTREDVDVFLKGLHALARR